MQNRVQIWYQVLSRGYCLLYSKIWMIYNTKSKIGDKFDTECKIGNVPNARAKYRRSIRLTAK